MAYISAIYDAVWHIVCNIQIHITYIYLVTSMYICHMTVELICYICCHIWCNLAYRPKVIHMKVCYSHLCGNFHTYLAIYVAILHTTSKYEGA